MVNVQNIVKKFNIAGDLVDYFPLGNGHINSTYLVSSSSGNEYVLQKINNYVFKDVDALMNNYYKVTEFLHNKGIETIRLVKTKDNKIYLKNEDGYFRVYEFIDNAIWYEKITDLQMINVAAKSFGKFHKDLKEFDAKDLKEVIPNFHNTKIRYENLLDAINEDKMGRVKDCLPEIEFVKSFEDYYGIIVNGIENGTLPLTVTHNDPKINNVLFDQETGKIRAVIDLDTIMPGSYLFDFGDALRSLFTGENEDCKDLSRLYVRYDVFKAYVKGYLSEMGQVLTQEEKELLPLSVFLLTIECGIRFLEDYIRGDVYFKTKTPDHNLIRARTQLSLAKIIFKKLNHLKAITNKYAK